MTDTDDVALSELQVAVLLISHLRFCWKHICVFVAVFCAFIAWPAATVWRAVDRSQSTTTNH